ncbi:MAG: peptidase M23 [Acidimicrobiales bacterium]
MASLASGVSAYIQVLPPGVGTVTFPFNPEEFTVTTQSDWNATPQPAAEGGGVQQFHGSKPSTTEVKILLDIWAIPPSPPMPAIAILKAAMQPTAESKLNPPAMPPKVTFGWGTNVIMEQAIITTMSVTYKRFLLGEPVRAEVSLSLEEVPIPVPGTNPTSGGLATRRTHMMVEGDSLASVAYQAYRDPKKWRALAALNGIDDPMRVPAGTELLVPEPGEAEAWS